MPLEDKLPKLLNEQQLEAVTAPGKPLLVVAGAGTGKTRVITYRVAHMIETGEIETREVWSPRSNDAEGTVLAPAPKELSAFVELGDAIVRSARIASYLNSDR